LLCTSLSIVLCITFFSNKLHQWQAVRLRSKSASEKQVFVENVFLIVRFWIPDLNKFQITFSFRFLRIFYQFVCGVRQSFESRFFKSKKIFQYSGKLKWKVVTCKQTCLLHNKLLMLQLIIILKVWWMGITYV
jgi:hypothetical protein